MTIELFMKKIMVSLVAILAGYHIANGITVSGTVCDTKEPLAGAIVALCAPDSVEVLSTGCDENGKFTLQKANLTSNMLKVSMTGYTTTYVSLPSNADHIETGAITMTNSSVELNEVSVAASGIINGIDKYTVYPREILLKNSASSLNVIASLSLPGLEVNPAMRTALIDGKNIIYQINGAPKSLNQILAIRPERISRIEYSDNPPIRYQNDNAGGVINFILKEKPSGGDLYQYTMGGLTCGIANNSTQVSYNYKDSEFTLGYNLELRDYRHNEVEREESYLAQSPTLSKVYDTKVGKMSYNTNDIIFTYAYVPHQGTMFLATASWNFGSNKWLTRNENFDFSDGLLTSSSDNNRNIKGSNSIPSLDLYLRQELRDKSTLEVNGVLTHIKTTSDWEQDFYYSSGKYERYINNVDNKKTSAIGEVSWLKPIKNVSLRLGVKNRYSMTHNRYTTATNDDSTELESEDLYLYSELSGQTGKLGYTIGYGFRYFKIDNGSLCEDHLCNLAKARIKLGSFGGFTANASLNFGPQLPPLGSMDDTEQVIDNLTMRVGNPKLKPAQMIIGSITTTFRCNDNFSTYLRGRIQRIWDPLFQEITFKDGYYITKTVNADRYINQHLEWNLSYTYNINESAYIKANIKPTVDHYVTAGNPSFRHTLTNWSVYGQLSFFYGNWSVFASVSPSSKSLYGEVESYTGPTTSLLVSWRWHDFTFTGFYQWIAYSKGDYKWRRNLSAINPSAYYSIIRDNANMIAASVSYNLNFGRQYSKKSRSIKNKDQSTSASILD